MGRNDKTSEIIDAILRFGLIPTSLAACLAFPGLAIGLEKPLSKIMQGMDKRQRERELKRVLSYMKRQKLVTEDYEFGIKVTAKGKKRLAKADKVSIRLLQPKVWDGLWRMVIYDIPERLKPERNALNLELRAAGFFQLQRSVWVHAFPCKDELENFCVHKNINKFVTIADVTTLNNDKLLIDKFKTKHPGTKFSINRAIA